MSVFGTFTKRIKAAANSVLFEMQGGFDVGRNKRRLISLPSSMSAINTLIRRYGTTIVARSRHLAVNNPYAVTAKEEFVSALVGDGIKPSSLSEEEGYKAALQELWTDWTDESDADGLTDFYGLQSIIGSEMFEAGECFVRFRPRRPEDGLTVPLQLQLLPTEMLPLDKNDLGGQNGNRIECGIEFDAIGRRVAYHFRRWHPGSDFNPGIGNITGNDSILVRVPAEEVLHLYRPIRAGQIRGIPHTLAGIITLAMIDLYDDAELERKRMAALFGAFVTRNAVDDDGHPLGLQTTTDTDMEGVDNAFTLEPGSVVDLLPGEDIKFSQPADVGPNYEGFQYRMLLRAAAGFGVPYANMTGDLRQANYGSIRAGLVAFRRRISAMQNHVMVFQFCRPVWQRFCDEAVLAGVLPTDAANYRSNRTSLIRAKWITPRWEWIDPLKDRQAELLAVRAGFKSREDTIHEEGLDPDTVYASIKAGDIITDKLGLVLDSDPRLTSARGITQAKPAGSVIPDPNADPNITPAVGVDPPPVPDPNYAGGADPNAPNDPLAP